MGSSQIRQSDVVAVKFQFVNHSGKSDSRTILIEKGMQIDLDGAKYTITDKGAVANNKGKKIVGSIMATKEHVALLQGLSQVNGDSNIQRTSAQSVLTSRDIPKDHGNEETMQLKINNQESRMGSSQSVKDFAKSGEVGYRFDSKNGAYNIKLSDEEGRITSHVSVSSKEDKAAVQKRNAENAKWRKENPKKAFVGDLLHTIGFNTSWHKE